MKKHIKRAWQFLWHDDSAWSWIANLIVAFLAIRFVVYPLLGLILGTPFPIVAVVSESMQHNLHDQVICGQKLDDFKESFDNWWDVCGTWYESNGISKEEFKTFSLQDGFNKGDVIILWRANNVELGDVLIFQADKAQPIIHRVVDVWQEQGQTFYQTKGDHNSDSYGGSLNERRISQDRVYGKGVIRLPYLGWIKILFVDAVRPLGNVIER